MNYKSRSGNITWHAIFCSSCPNLRYNREVSMKIPGIWEHFNFFTPGELNFDLK